MKNELKKVQSNAHEHLQYYFIFPAQYNLLFSSSHNNQVERRLITLTLIFSLCKKKEWPMQSSFMPQISMHQEKEKNKLFPL